MSLNNPIRASLICLALLLTIFNENIIHGQTLAFPSAEGFGRFTSGGRGGSVIEVTNLDDTGPGSLRTAIGTAGKRIIVFRVSGTIELQSKLSIKWGDLTIAGQTAPGDGICIANFPVYVDASNVIIRYMRFRMGDKFQQAEDALGGRNRKNIIIDHCSMSWSIDEASSFYDNENFTMQWCIISESLWDSYHPKGKHGYGGIWGGIGATFHHNLLAHHTSRNPRFNGNRYRGDDDLEDVDFVNNVIYNWGFNSAYGGEKGNQNVRLNYYKAGPATSSSVKYRIVEPSDDAGDWYINGNYVYGSPEITADNWAGGVQGSHADVQKQKNIFVPFGIDSVLVQSPEEAFELVLENAGCNFPVRDTLDRRIVRETREGTAEFGASYQGGKKGIIDSQDDVGGWPVLVSAPPPTDSDHDGMPDDWETSNGYDPNNDSDRNIKNADGYTALEVYINSLVEGPLTVLTNEETLPNRVALYQNYPNPFNPETTLKYSLDKSGFVSLSIFNSLGQKVKDLVFGYKSSGIYYTSWHPVNMSSGIYFALLRTDGKVKTIKLTYSK